MSALVHGLRILRLFNEQTPTLALSEISRTMGLSKSNTHRILTLMVEERMLEKTANGAYRLSFALFELGSRSVGQFEHLRQMASPVMSNLVRQTAETVHLGILDQGEVIYLHKIESPYNLRIMTRVGLRFPSYCTATGKALIAFQPPEVIGQVCALGLNQYSPTTITEPDRLVQDLEHIRQTGYSTCDDEFERGVRAVGAPIRDRTGEVIASISLVAPIPRMSKHKMAGTAVLVMQAAREISEELGFDSRLRARVLARR